MKAINLQVNDWLYGKIKTYTADRGDMPVVVAIRSILSEFFRNKANGMKYEDLPAGIIDLGEGKGFVINMEMLRDKEGVVHVPPADLTKEQTWEWIRKYHNGKKGE